MGTFIQTSEVRLVGRLVMVHQTPYETEGVARIKSVIIAPSWDATTPGGTKVYSAYCMVEFGNERGTQYQRWISTSQFLCPTCGKPEYDVITLKPHVHSKPYQGNQA